MTAYHDAQSIEARKARYSRELAAYTLKQWDLVRQAMEEGQRDEKSASPPSRQDRSGSVPRDTEKSARTRQGASVSFTSLGHAR